MTTATSTHARWLHISAPIVSNPITGLPDPQRPGATYEPGGLHRKTRRIVAVDERRTERKRLWRQATGGLPNRMRATCYNPTSPRNPPKR